MSAPLISVITPFFNAERYVKEAIESVLNQTHRPLELLLVDDGSTDGSFEIAVALARENPELQLLRLSRNQGVAAARNAALAVSRGEFITFHDADDIMVAYRLSFQLDYLTRHPEVDMVMGTMEIFFESGVEPPPSLQKPHADEDNPRHCLISIMVRRAVFDKVGLFDPSYRVGSDTEWILRAQTTGAVLARLNRVLTHRRIHGTNLIYQYGERRNELKRAVIGLVRHRIAKRRRSP
jgi:glycosyltransferase involved in cell wall biosynthesis